MWHCPKRIHARQVYQSILPSTYSKHSQLAVHDQVNFSRLHFYPSEHAVREGHSASSCASQHDSQAARPPRTAYISSLHM
jgi:hypothetical protein